MKKFVIVALIGVAILAGGWFGRSAYRQHKEKRAIRQAEAFMEKKNFSNALISARQALQLNPNNVAACRIMAALAESGGSPHALGWRKRIAELEPTLDNKLVLASCALRFESAPYPITTTILEEIAPQSAQLPAFHIVTGKLALQLNDLAQAETHLSEAARLDPGNESNRLNLAALQVRSPDAAKADEARRTLEQLRGSPQFGTEALRWLQRDREERGDKKAALVLSTELIEKKDARDADRFQHLTLLHDSKTPEFAGYLKFLQTNAGTNAVEIYKVAAWQIAAGMEEESLAWLATLAVPLQEENPIPVARAEALASLKKWSELTDFLRSQKWKEQEFLRLGLLARALKELHERDAAQANWNRAVREASENAEHLSVLTQLAGKWRWESETEALLWIVAEKFPGQAWALESIQRAYEASKNTAGLLRVFETRLKSNSKDSLARNNVAMLSLLLKTNLPSAYQMAEQVYHSDAKNGGFVSTYAYSLHAQGKTPEAVKLFRGLEPAQLENPAMAAYYVILLSATGEKETARKYVAFAEKASILPEERSQLEEAKRRL